MTVTEPTHILYHFKYSICSIMVRYAFACRGDPVDAKNEMRLKEVDVDLLADEQNTEHFLCDVNGNGEVPVLVNVDTGDRLSESIDITLLMGRSYPTLLPKGYEEEIKRLLYELHSINFFSLTFTGQHHVPQAWMKYLTQQKDGDISERYRLALEQKMKRVDKQKVNGLAEDNVQQNIDRTIAVTAEFDKILQDSATDWCFGLQNPSALDAHLVVFIARMQDVRRDDLLPESLRRYGAKAFATPVWKDVMQGRTTKPPGSR